MLQVQDFTHPQLSPVQYGDADFLFQQHLVLANSAKTTSDWFADHGIMIQVWRQLSCGFCRGQWSPGYLLSSLYYSLQAFVVNWRSAAVT